MRRVESVLLGAILLSGSPAIAGGQTVTQSVEQDTEADTGYLHFPGYDGPSRGSSLTLEIAPQIVSHNPLGVGSQTTNVLDLSLTFATEHRIGDTLELEFDAGGSKTIDNDDGSFSNLAATLELRTRPGDSGFSAFGSYNIARDYTDFLDQGLGTNHSVTAGLRFGRSIGTVDIGLELAPRWVESSEAGDDNGALNLWGEVVVPVIGDAVLLIVDSSIERRWYQDRDPVLLAKRRDWRFATYAGLDFSGALRTGRGLRVSALGVGVEWLEVSSNFDSAERSDLSFLPAISIGISF